MVMMASPTTTSASQAAIIKFGMSFAFTPSFLPVICSYS
ncbi:hypothetical protein STRCR_0114 [Streptococcus criceti HS-6]|uniref:Uncharacterized protein n=1 Tax=Streptococcus criceti HS-6 TaxID=873449 RepID=G5JN77_STRCG|nr:hypothetical protein STRCR_0114 [Streptococcus criceti HS-6]